MSPAIVAPLDEAGDDIPARVALEKLEKLGPLPCGPQRTLIIAESAESY